MAIWIMSWASLIFLRKGQAEEEGYSIPCWSEIMNLKTIFFSSHPLLSSTMNRSLVLAHSQFLSPDSLLKLKQQILPSNVQNLKLRTPRSYSLPVVNAAQFNFFKALQRVWKVGNDGIEAGTNLVPASIPRPVAKIAVTFVAVAVGLFILNSFLSTAFFVLGTMGLVYFIFIALNQDEGPRGGGGGSGPTTSSEETLEEARRIMQKYK